MKRLFIDEIDNMRDLGGYTIKDKGMVPYNKFIRSNLPTYLSEKSIEKLIKNNVTTIIDLRSDEEINKKQSIFFNNSEFDYYHIKINGDGRLPDTFGGVYDSYIEMIEGKEEIGKIFKILANNSGGTIYYCNAGKDRTGVVSALILKLLGADNKDIIDDYTVSGVFLHKMLKDFSEKIKKDNIMNIITPKPDTMIRFLKNLDYKYKGIENYLMACGVDKSEIESIKNLRLLYDEN